MKNSAGAWISPIPCIICDYDAEPYDLPEQYRDGILSGHSVTKLYLPLVWSRNYEVKLFIKDMRSRMSRLRSEYFTMQKAGQITSGTMLKMVGQDVSVYSADDEPKPEPKRVPRHWLLSTDKTMTHFGIHGHTGSAFDFNRQWNRNPTEKSVYRLYQRTMYDVIIPNALVAKEYGKRVEYTDVVDAVDYVMGSNERRSSAWRSFVGDTGSNRWLLDNVKPSVEFYLYDKLKDSEKHLPPEERWTLDRYLDGTKAGRFVEDSPVVIKGSSSPKLEKVKAAFMRNREIGSWSYGRIMEELGVSREVVARFFRALKERRKSWSDMDGAFF